METVLSWINGFVWGLPALVLILGVGLYLSLRTGFAQLRLFPDALRRFWGMLLGRSGDSFRALCTALAATVGTGNIAGVAGAIAIGGPGSIFWMWLCALLGMVTKYAEAVLCVRWRIREEGELLGGPMYVIRQAMGQGWGWLSVCYCLFGALAAFGMGNATQLNAAVDALGAVLIQLRAPRPELWRFLLGTVLALATAAALLGGAKRIGSVAEVLVPVAAGAYILLSLGALTANAGRIPQALASIISGAFCPRAVTGGMLGSAFLALRVGASRGVFTNEAGMGTAGIAHASAAEAQPVQQGLMGIMEVFLDTLLICTLTALVILTSGVEIPYGTDPGAELTTRAFQATYGSWISIPMALFLGTFAFATMLGWGLYGLRCVRYLLGKGPCGLFVAVQAAAAVLSLRLDTGAVWMLSETVNGLMAIPNLITLAILTPQVVQMTGEYEKKSARRRSFNSPLRKRGGPTQKNRRKHSTM